MWMTNGSVETLHYPVELTLLMPDIGNPSTSVKPQDSFGRFVKNFVDLQKVDHTIRKHH